MRSREGIAWTLLLVGALALRLWALDARPPHHDEAVHAHFANVLLTQGAYRYDPTYHGPLLFYVTAAVFALLGESLTTLRLYPALAGVALVALPLTLRRRLGARTAWWCGLVLAISPSLLYYSRFARNDVPVALFTAAALAFLLRVRREGWRRLPWVGVFAALHAISKETFYVATPLLVAAGGAVAVAVGGVRTNLAAIAAWVRSYRIPLATATLWFVAITVTAYTFVAIHPEDAVFPLRAIAYWYQQHSIQRVGGPWFYHFPRLALYEFLIVAAALVWVVRRRRRMGRIEVFCLVWGVASLLAYAYLGEKVPWLLIHQILPLVPLAAMQLGRTFSPRGAWWSRGIAGAAIVATCWSAAAPAYLYPTITPKDRHAELLVFVQTTPEAGRLAEQGRELARTELDGPVAAVTGEASWPLSWQWRDLRVWWSLPPEGTQPPLVVCDPGDEAKVMERVGIGYDVRQIPLRGWWVEEWSGVTGYDVVRWFATRRPWSPLGATDVLVFEKSGEVGGEEGERP